jgi:mannose-6-phosphate isomerase-like protein (cupin superfamily)
MEAFRLKRIDELASIHHGAVKLAADELGVGSFGMQVLDFPAGFDDYPEHDHAEDGQEEVYVVLAGSADFEVAGERVPTEEGSMLWVGPGTMRTLTAGDNGVRILAIGCVPNPAYERPGPFKVDEQS